jgi:dUTP pyrophosphatase
MGRYIRRNERQGVHRGELEMKISFAAGLDWPPLKPGARVGQLVFVQTYVGDLTLVDELTDTARGEGGFGHTGE